ncbi:MAG: efflux RND transporter permease subunit [Candidatus Zixiibacteriota bacterium]|nr:MAG: efflux RND transporter permease subunit [candidate division Zixibacteria bacterium]
MTIPPDKGSLIPRLSVTRPISVLMIALAVLAVGAIAYSRLPVSLLPGGFDPPYLWVWVSYRTSNPAEVEEQITRPMEEQLRTVRNLKEVNARSGSNGASFWLEFEKKTDMNVAYNQVYDRLERARSQMPQDQRYWRINRFSEDDEPIVYFGINLNRYLDDPYYTITEHIQRPLERIDGVAKVEVWGAYEKVIQIELDAQRAQAHGVDLYALAQNLERDNFALTSGWVMDGGRKLFVRSMGRYETIEEISKLPVKGTNVRLEHVANVSYSIPEIRWYQRLNRQPAVNVAVYKESTANTVETCDEILQVIEGDLKQNPVLRGAQYEIFFNQGRHILEAVGNLKTSGLWGALFAFWVLFFFLRHWRMTAIITLAMPLSLLATIIFLYFTGWSLNAATLMGMMISIGMVVDNAIVITESIFLARTRGLAPHEAALRGASEVALAVTMGTLTTVVVFLPLILMNDDVGFSFYMLRIGMPVIVAIVASLTVALLIIPLATKALVTPGRVRTPRLIEAGSRIYRRALTFTLDHRFDAVLVILALFLVSQFYIAGKIPKTDMTEGNINDFRLMFRLPENYTEEKARTLVETVENLLFEKAEEYDLRSVQSRYSRTFAHVQAYLHPTRDDTWWKTVVKGLGQPLGLFRNEPMSRADVIEDMKKRVPELPGVEMSTNWRWDSSSESAVTVNLYGDDTATLVKIGEDLKRHFRTLPSVLGVELDMEDGSSEVQVRLNREQARRYDLNPQRVAGTISYALRGYDLPDFHAEDHEISMRAQLAKSDRETLEQLKNLSFYSESGRDIPLTAAADFHLQKGWGEIQRLNGKTSLALKITTAQENMETLAASIDQVLAGLELPRGYSFDKGNRFRDMEESNRAQTYGIILAVVFVFLLMGVLFESFVLPFSVLVSIPFAFIGAYWMLFLTGTALDIMAGIGMIILVGVVVNNAIVLVDLINRLRQEGMPRREALIEAGQRRFRPILMTALTTICGLLPMALGNAGMVGIPYAPLGRTLIGGLMSGTALTLLLVPITYSYFDDLRVFMKMQSSRLFRRKEALS